MADFARLVLRGDAEIVRLAGAAFGVAIPLDPCLAATNGARSALWLGPDEFLLLAEGEPPASLSASLESALAALPHSLVDVSDRQVALPLAAPQAARTLSAGCPLDLDLSAFPVGMATRTIFGKAEIVLWRRDVAGWHVEVARSFAAYVRDLLAEAGRGLPDW